LDFLNLSKIVDAVNEDEGTGSAASSGPPKQAKMGSCLTAQEIQSMQKATSAALEGIAQDKLEVEEAALLIALAFAAVLGKALERGVDLKKAGNEATKWLVGVMRAHGISASNCELMTALVYQKLLEVMERSSAAKKEKNVEAAMNVIEAGVIVAFKGLRNKTFTMEQSVGMVGAAVAGAIVKCDISSESEFETAFKGFSAWMIVLAKKHAPEIPDDLMAAYIAKVWKAALEILTQN